MFARMRERAGQSGMVKRAVIGGTVAGVAGLVAYKNPVLRKKALGIASAGLALAAGYSGRAYEAAKEEADRRTTQAVVLGRAYKDWMVEQGQSQGEKLISSAVDAPFSWAEGALAGHMDKRMRNLETLAAKRLSGAQDMVTGAAVTKAKQLTKLNLPEHTSGDVRTRLRREVQTKKWESVFGDLRMAAMRSGQSFFVPRSEDLHTMMTKAGIPATEANKLKVTELWLREIAPRRTFGGDNDFARM